MIFRLFLFGMLLPLYLHADDSLYFHVPDANLKSTALLASRMTAYFRVSGLSMSFQAVKDEEQLLSLIKLEQPTALICSQDFYDRHHRSLGLQPFLQPLKNGQRTYRKILLTKDPNAPASLATSIIASTPVGPTVIRDLLIAKYGKVAAVTPPRVLPVSKDLDAIFAVLFGRSTASLVVPENLEIFRRIDPKGAALLHILATTEPLPLSSVCSVGKSLTDSKVENLRSALLALKQSQQGREILGMLNYDSFAPTGEVKP